MSTRLHFLHNLLDDDVVTDETDNSETFSPPVSHNPHRRPTMRTRSQTARKRASTSAPPSTNETVPKRRRHVAQRQGPNRRRSPQDNIDLTEDHQLVLNIFDLTAGDESPNPSNLAENAMADESEVDLNSSLYEDIERVRQFETDEEMARSLQMEWDQEVVLHMQQPSVARNIFEHLAGIAETHATATEHDHRLRPRVPSNRRVRDSSDVSETDLMEVLGASPNRRSTPGQGRRMRLLGTNRSSAHVRTLIQRILSSNDMADGSYETMIDLVERIGEVESDGLTVSELSKLTTVTFKIKDDVGDRSCIVCMNEYKQQEKLRLLHCNHRFHKNCIDRWLKTKPNCPICRANVRSHMQLDRPSTSAD